MVADDADQGEEQALEATPIGEEPPAVEGDERLTASADQEEVKQEATPIKQDDKKKQRKKKYVLKGGASALAIQMFGIDDRYEMRYVDLS